jgi:hypothetical protein
MITAFETCSDLDQWEHEASEPTGPEPWLSVGPLQAAPRGSARNIDSEGLSSLRWLGSRGWPRGPADLRGEKQDAA